MLLSREVEARIEARERHMRRHRHICPVCERPFRGTHNQKYCSPMCIRVIRKEKQKAGGPYPIPLFCAYCNENFIPLKSGQLYCKEKCSQLAEDIHIEKDDGNEELRYRVNV